MKYTTFFATDQQVIAMCVNVCNASSVPHDPLFSHFAQGIIEVSDNDIELTQHGISIDYRYGVMVNIDFKRLNVLLNDFWNVSFSGCVEPRIDHQSWIWKYPSFKDLAVSAGVVLEDGKIKT